MMTRTTLMATLFPVFSSLLGENVRQNLYYLISALLAVLVLVGISRMSKVEKAVRGNQLGALSMLLAILLSLWYFRIFTVVELWLAMLIGLAIGLWIARKVKMIEMPQLVGLLNGFGGLASMIAGALSLLKPLGEGAAQPDYFSLMTAGLAVVVGGLTWSGSVVAAGKLHKLFDQRPKVYARHQLWTNLFLALSLLSAFAFTLPLFADKLPRILLLLLAIVASHLFGYFFSIRVGGADMPITISLLNSFSGIAGSIAGMAIADPLLVAVGGIVGASGLLLTQIMCRAMNRHLMDILLGKTSGASVAKAAKSVPVSAAPVQSSATTATAPVQSNATSATASASETAGQGVASDALPARGEVCGSPLACRLHEAKRVILIPGYGMALSQAQSRVKQLADLLEDDGKELDFAIHPVAGRMPGHMNVLLAEVDVPYEKLREMDEINDRFSDCDLAIVVGANDVVNSAANSAEGTPIYGMPILNVANARHIFILNFDRKPGYAGVDNPLYDEANKGANAKVSLLLGDAKASLDQLLQDYRELKKSAANAAGCPDAQETSVSVVGADGQAADVDKPDPISWFHEAKRVILVPGYGMALSQAQPLVRQLSDRLESAGKEVNFAIHPVAGRMPGHMNVLLAEVDVPYDKLLEMQDINPEFKNCDLAVVIGANDVVNPAANTAEGTPIYGMPILDIADARHVLILNFDRKPGYAGVENPLYDEAEQQGQDHVALLLGDAKESLRQILDRL